MGGGQLLAEKRRLATSDKEGDSFEAARRRFPAGSCGNEFAPV